MTEMVERVARAISGTGAFDGNWECHMLAARAAIEAMREPTEEMCLAGRDYDAVSKWTAQIVWENMVRAALQNR